jgi:two-component sensor histidine kinase
VRRLQETMGRIDALATVHRRLYQADDVTRFDIGAFAANLATDIVQGSGHDGISIRSDLRRAEVPAGHAAAVGLIINEVLTNSVRHGFPDGRDGAIGIAARTEGSRAILTLEDDGVGFDVSDRALRGLGRVLIEQLSCSAGAAVRHAALDPGTRVTISIATTGNPE